MNTPEEIIAVVQAHIDGKQIEVKTKGGTQWHLANPPTWNFNRYEYRIKPKPDCWVQVIDTSIVEFKDAIEKELLTWTNT